MDSDERGSPASVNSVNLLRSDPTVLVRWLWLGIIVAASVHLRGSLSAYTPRFDPEDETGYYRTESAYQYRYARMAAAGLKLPDVDKEAQWPEGVKPKRELTPTMELATGGLYRLLGLKLDFRWYVVLWVAVVSSLSIPALYFLAVTLTDSPWASLSAAAVYGLSWGAMSNVVASYTFESFTLPLIHWSLAFFAAALAKRSRGFAWASGLSLALALSSWHFTRFYLLSFVLALGWAAWRCRADESALARLRGALLPVLLCALATGLFVPVMREGALALSPAMFLGFGLWAALRFPKQAKYLLGAAFLVAAVRALSAADAGSYGHVYALFLAKARFGFVKPANPALLTQEERALWMGPFNSPNLGFAVFCLVPLAFVLLPRAAAPLLKEDKPAQDPLLAALSDALFALYALGATLVLRVMQMFVFFLCLASLRLPKRLLASFGLAAFLCALAFLEATKSFAPSSRLNPFMRLSAAVTSEDLHPTTSFESELGVIRWMRRYSKGAPVLANVAFSSTFLTYAGNPILLHPKFEAPGIRAKTADFLDALFSSEEDFAKYCEKYGAKLFVFSVYEGLDQTSDGPLYLSGRDKLSKDAAAVLFQFHPDKLRRFKLAYQNEGFRVYALGGGYGKPQGEASPVWDLSQFSPSEAADGTLTLQVESALRRQQDAKLKVFLARIYQNLGRREEAIANYELAFKEWPADEASAKDYDGLRRQIQARR